VPAEGLKLSSARWEGTVSGEARLTGSFVHPTLRFAANGEGLQIGGVPVGSVQVGGTLRDGVLAATATTEGVRLWGEAKAAGDMPFEARAEIDVDDVTRFLPGGPPAGLRLRARGEAQASGLLADPAAARAEFRLADLQVGYADFRVQNKEPVILATDRARVEVRSLTLVGANTEFSLTGAREADGRLSLVADGSLDLRLLGGLLPGVARPHGKLGIEAHVSGTAAEPLLVGSGRLRDAGFTLRDLPVAFTAIGGDLAFSQNRVIFDRLPAAVNGGRAVIDGELELVRFTPARVRLQARLDEVPLRIPSWMPPWVSGQLTLAGTFDSMLLSGKLDVVRALYSERVELEKNLIEVKRRVAAPRVFDKGGDWLRLDVAIVLGGDIRVDNDLLRGGVRGELTLTGTLAGYGLVGSLAMTPGTRATFRGNEFILSHAVAEFTERRRVRVHLDVHGEAQVRDYQVFMHLFGPFDDPQLQLTSLPSLTQEDVVTLLSMGITSRDTAVAGAGTGVTGAATAAAAQALFSASGLDEQAKRFLAREGLFKDFTLRITSAYSEVSGQVVPKAEVESKAAVPWLGIKDLRLRYQAPIAGSNQGKGQRAQAEARFSEKFSGQIQVDNESPETPLDLGADLRFRWEWND
jgi:translocation and assembly module TamB